MDLAKTETAVVGTVYLNVANHDRMMKFYQETIGLHELRRDGETVYLGTGKNELLALIPKSNGIHYPRTTGLFHFAILLPTREDLGRAFRHLLQHNVNLQGASDHIVSEALYLADPEGNGIEIYRDRPRGKWYKEGQFQLATLAMDTDGVLRAGMANDSVWRGLPDDTIMGHIHLHVADVSTAEAFYGDILGMDVMANMESATFMSYDGYHHHLGANVWGGRVPPPADALGLDHYVLTVADSARYEAITARLQANNIPIETTDNGIFFRDPSQNAILLTR